MRGAVAVMGPSQSGKTTGLIEGVAAWEGPAIVSSVKTDLLRSSLADRSAAGEVKVFDPLGITTMEKATWSPLRAARDLKGALAAAQMLARAGGDEGPHDRFWRGQAEQLIAAMLWTAANTEGHSMRNVVKWVLDLDRPAGDDNGTLAPLVRLLTDHGEPAVALAARQVQGWLHGQWKTDSRTTSSVYATARNAVWPWADPDVAASAEGCDITPRLAARRAQHALPVRTPRGRDAHRRRLCRPAPRLSHPGVRSVQPPGQALGAQAAGDARRGCQHAAAKAPAVGVDRHRCRDAAGHRLASKGQLDQVYGRDADAVLTNHRTKLVYPSGLSDMATIDYVSALVGKEHVRSDLDEQSWHRAGERPPARTPATAVPFVPGSVLRQMEVGDALLLHGELPPAWIRSPCR